MMRVIIRVHVEASSLFTGSDLVYRHIDVLLDDLINIVMDDLVRELPSGAYGVRIRVRIVCTHFLSS
jgi:hypothetical protein